MMSIVKRVQDWFAGQFRRLELDHLARSATILSTRHSVVRRRFAPDQ
jgi:hypothetical protein